ncbi:uncharacterized protein LOC120359685 [Solenopsis invicta]|uniref:uncharacterized protein LOC120359685 n=1 Tax=Solenopsis invicta TaxID=13686 RepID=UPI00193CEB78|nr:uncharacterized protein LOC120359685 [Solenopsis invicta]
MDDVADGLWLDLILTLRFAYTPSPLDESPSFIEKREDFAHLVSSATLTIDPSRDAPLEVKVPSRGNIANILINFNIDRYKLGTYIQAPYTTAFASNNLKAIGQVDDACP